MSSYLLCSGARCLNLWMQTCFHQTWEGALYYHPSMQSLGQRSWISCENTICGLIQKFLKERKTWEHTLPFQMWSQQYKTRDIQVVTFISGCKLTAAEKEILACLFRGSHFHSFWLGVGCRLLWDFTLIGIQHVAGSWYRTEFRRYFFILSINPLFNCANGREASLRLCSQSSNHATGFPVLHLEDKFYFAPDLPCALYSSKVPQVVILVCKNILKELISWNTAWM